MQPQDKIIRDSLHFRLGWAARLHKSALQAYPWRTDSMMRVFQLHDGQADVELRDGRQFSVRAGQSYLIPSWLQFRHRFSGDSSRNVRGAVFRFEILGSIDPLQAYRFPNVLDPEQAEPIALITDRIADMAGFPETEDALIGAARLQRTAMDLLETLLNVAMPRGENRLNSAQLVRLQPAIDYLETHLNEPPRVAQLARTAGLSESHFATLFKQVFHITPMAYHRRLRLQHAQQLLVNSRESLADIAFQLGYTDQAHFTRSFTTAFGQSPAKYRRTHSTREE